MPRKKRSILWLIAGVFLLLLGLFFFQLFGPNPPIIVSPQTTYITEPLGPNGLPDYESYVLEQYREGVTPQNNAAALLCAALWPGELQPGEYASVAKELGLSQIPSKSEALVPVYKYVSSKPFTDWLTQQTPSLANNNADADGQFNEGDSLQRDLEKIIEQVFEQSMSRPWTSEQIPPLAEWVHANEKPLDLLLEASRRRRCYFPSTSLLKDEGGMLIGMLLSGPQGAREVARSLPVRAMWHLGEGHPDEAWQDLLAIHRIGRLVAQGQSLVEQLIGIAIDDIACDRTQTFLHHGNLSVEQHRQIRRDLAALPPFAGAAKTIDESERLLTVDALVQLAATNDANWNETMAIIGNEAGGLPILQFVSVDWNLVLRDINRWYDRLGAAANTLDRADRAAAIEKIQADVQTLFAEAQRPTKMAVSAVSRQQRSELVAAVMLGIFLPSVDVALQTEDRANATMRLTALAAALAEYRATHGAYPEKLDDLVPALLDKLPVDVYSAAPLVYKREGEGFLLYSAGENGKDDGGSNEQQRIYAGQALDDLDEAEAERRQSKIPTGADDISMGVPRPALKPPRISPPAAP